MVRTFVLCIINMLCNCHYFIAGVEKGTEMKTEQEKNSAWYNTPISKCIHRQKCNFFWQIKIYRKINLLSCRKPELLWHPQKIFSPSRRTGLFSFMYIYWCVLFIWWIFASLQDLGSKWKMKTYKKHQGSGIIADTLKKMWQTQQQLSMIV